MEKDTVFKVFGKYCFIVLIVRRIRWESRYRYFEIVTNVRLRIDKGLRDRIN